MTGKILNCNGIPIVIPNDITYETTDFYISYNDRDTHIYGDVTTALVVTKKGQSPTFLILNGNHCEEYKKIIANAGGYIACLDYFKNHHNQQSKYSENWNERLIYKDGKLIIIKEY